MRYSRKADAVGTLHIEQAARPPRPSIGIEGYFLNLAHTRDVPEPEPVTWRDLNGREPLEWEEPLIVAARERERRMEMVLLAGTLGQP